MSQIGEWDRVSADPAGSLRNNEAASEYLSLIREIPPREHVDILVRSFFTNVSWQYDIIDEAMFREELLNWRHVSYAMLKGGPDSLPVNTRYFPALLFQILALSLLFQPFQYDSALDSLKYVPDMDFADLAADYSIAGHRMMTMLGRRDVSLIKVQAGLMKACFEKSIGSVIESWHTLGSAIRDAQELGLHRPGSWEARPSVEEATQQREADLGRRLWLVLHLWDAHMAVVLGRPMATRLDPSLVSSTAPSRASPTWGPHDVTLAPFDFILCGYHAAYKYLQDIYNLEAGPSNAAETVREIHNAIVRNISQLPAWATSQDPRLDCQYPWLPAARETLITEIYFVLLALHRPLMFSAPTSRAEALKAALQMLESQNRLFKQAGPNMHMTFTLVFSTFDAMVLVAGTYIRFPDDNLNLLPQSVKCMEWGLARLDAMRSRNAMAGFAHDIVGVLHRKVLRCIPSLPEPPAVGVDEPRDLLGATQVLSADDAGQEAPASRHNLDNPLLQQPLYHMVCDDLIGEDFSPEQADMAYPGRRRGGETSIDRFWQLMDDLT